MFIFAVKIFLCCDGSRNLIYTKPSGSRSRHFETWGFLIYKNMNGKIEDHGNFKHGLMDHPLYSVWSSMKYRCRPKSRYRNESWAGRGIVVCEEWQSFMPFYKWATENGYEKGLTLDRRDNDGNYEPSNCRFVTYSVQNLNKRRPARMPR